MDALFSARLTSITILLKHALTHMQPDENITVPMATTDNVLWYVSIL